MNNVRSMYKLRQILFFKRGLTEVIRTTPNIPKVSKSDRITSAIKLYVSKCSDTDKVIEKEREEFEFGRNYLAKMMGADPMHFTQEDIDAAIQYLFPSGLEAPAARPIMTDPSYIHQRKKSLQCDNLGRPFHSFYYNKNPVFSKILHDANYATERLKALEDNAFRNQTITAKSLEFQCDRWMNNVELSSFCVENIPEVDFQKWTVMMDRIYKHPYSSAESDFITQFRVKTIEKIQADDIPIPSKDPETGRMFAESYGQKKWTTADVRLYMPGSGKLTINGESLIDALPNLSDRETLLFPLRFTDTLEKVDIIAHSNAVSGMSCLSLSLRLAVSRGLSCFLSSDEVDRMRLAGLLSQDERYREAKQPGQPKARKKPAWRPR